MREVKQNIFSFGHVGLGVVLCPGCKYSQYSSDIQSCAFFYAHIFPFCLTQPSPDCLTASHNTFHRALCNDRAVRFVTGKLNNKTSATISAKNYLQFFFFLTKITHLRILHFFIQLCFFFSPEMFKILSSSDTFTQTGIKYSEDKQTSNP